LGRGKLSIVFQIKFEKPFFFLNVGFCITISDLDSPPPALFTLLPNLICKRLLFDEFGQSMCVSIHVLDLPGSGGVVTFMILESRGNLTLFSAFLCSKNVESPSLVYREPPAVMCVVGR
jgi:hypothetical protein